MATRLASDPRTARWQVGSRVPVAVLALGLLVTAGAAWAAREGVQERRAQRLDSLAQGAGAAVQRQITSYSEALFGLRALFAVDPEVTRADFHDALVQSDIFRRFPGARALTFDRVVPSADKAAFEARVRGDTSLNGIGYPDFRVHPGSNAPDLLVVEYVEPMEGNEAAFGFDVGSDPVRRAAAVEARDSGDLAASAPVTLIQSGRGFLLFLAAYDTRAQPVTPPARRRHLEGLLVAAFESDKMLGEVLGSDPRLDIKIYDVGLTVEPPRPALERANLVFEAGGGGGSDGGLRRILDLDVGSRRWRILATPGAELSSAAERLLPWMVLGMGVILSGLAAGLVHSFGRSRWLAVALAAEMTTHLRQREQELEDANRLLAEVNAQLAEADREKTAFLSTISHELQTPLTSIRGFSGLLLDAGLPDQEALDYARRIARNADALSTLITELLEFSRLERDEVSLTLEPLPLSELVPAVVDQLGTVLAGHRLRLQVEPGVTVRADPHAVTRILTNLLVNAVKFSPAGTEVVVTVTVDGRMAELSVLDEGPGVPKEDQPRVFERFFRGSDPRIAHATGTGIGLAVVRELAQRMGGGVEVANRDGAGARFTVRLALEFSGD